MTVKCLCLQDSDSTGVSNTACILLELMGQWIADTTVTPVPFLTNYNCWPPPWYFTKQVLVHRYTKEKLQAALDTQSQIGWHNLTRCCKLDSSTNGTRTTEEQLNSSYHKHSMTNVLQTMKRLTHTIWRGKNSSAHHSKPAGSEPADNEISLY